LTAFNEIWIEQCEAALAIRARFGLPKALGYLVGEKLLNFVRAAEEDQAFATELPAFVAHVRELFAPQELAESLDSGRRTGAMGHVMDDETHAFARAAGMFSESVVRAAEPVPAGTLGPSGLRSPSLPVVRGRFSFATGAPGGKGHRFPVVLLFQRR